MNTTPRSGPHIGRFLLGAALSGFVVTALPQCSTAGTGLDRPWAPFVRALDQALVEANVGEAERQWHRAYSEALRARNWEGFLDVGNAYLRIGDAANGRKFAVARARQLYRVALFRARSQDSVDGALRTAQAFAALGDHEVVELCLRVADQVADRTSDLQARQRVAAFRAQWRAGSIVAGNSAQDPLLLLFPDESVGP